MTVTCELPPDVVSCLERKAAQEGQETGEYLRQLALREAEAEGNEPSAQPRIAGLHAGWYWIADDFDAPLPESFWLGTDTA